MDAPTTATLDARILRIEAMLVTIVEDLLEPFLAGSGYDEQLVGLLELAQEIHDERAAQGLILREEA
jgi:hypothetical protein